MLFGIQNLFFLIKSMQRHCVLVASNYELIGVCFFISSNPHSISVATVSPCVRGSHHRSSASCSRNWNKQRKPLNFSMGLPVIARQIGIVQLGQLPTSYKNRSNSSYLSGSLVTESQTFQWTDYQSDIWESYYICFRPECCQYRLPCSIPSGLGLEF